MNPRVLICENHFCMRLNWRSYGKLLKPESPLSKLYIAACHAWLALKIALLH